ncbi:MAG: GntR family transcriptional regulator [Candidatus Dormiibacterota bacterium]
MIDFRIDGASGLTTYGQIVQQVRQAVRLGRLLPGDQLPTIKDVVAKLAINPNTVLKAYRELEVLGLVDSRQGQGTFIRSSAAAIPKVTQANLERSFLRWLRSAHAAGLDVESIKAIIEVTLNEDERNVGAA